MNTEYFTFGLYYVSIEVIKQNAWSVDVTVLNSTQASIRVKLEHLPFILRGLHILVKAECSTH